LRRRSLAIGLCILLICSIFIPITVGFNVKVSKIEQPSNMCNGNTLYVGGSGPSNYTRIQDAIDNATGGDTVYVYSGIYYENIIVDKTINLIGENRETTVIDGGYTRAEIVDVRVDNIEICCFTIMNGYPGINLYNSDNHKIYLNNIIDNWIGLSLTYSNNNQISNNFISSNGYIGIELHFISSNNTFSYNNILNNGDSGIWFEACCNNTISNNIIKSNNQSGLWFEDYCYNNIIYNNTIILNKNYGGIHGCNDFSFNTISFNTFINNRFGIYIMYGFGNPSDNNQIYRNNFIDNTPNAIDECNNVWDDGKYGNYWSDYKEKYPDARKKLLKPWMWNTPYEIYGGNNTDSCPLVNQWPDPRPRTITRDTSINYLFLMRLLDVFPLLKEVILRLIR
jgi:parallel beta-helix repeat protein